MLPIDIASLPLTLRPVNMSSFAIDFPTSLGSLAVPPALQKTRSERVISIISF